MRSLFFWWVWGTVRVIENNCINCAASKQGPKQCEFLNKINFKRKLFDRNILILIFQTILIYLWATTLKQKNPYADSRSRPAILLHDNAQSRTVKRIKNIIYTLGWEGLTWPPSLPLSHAAYSPISHYCTITYFSRFNMADKHIKTIPSAMVFVNWQKYQLTKWWELRKISTL